MLETPQVLEVEAQPAAMIHLVVPRTQIQEVMGPGLTELVTTLRAQGVAPRGPWFNYHRRAPSETFDFDLGVPVAGAVKPSGRVAAGELPKARVARVVYQGGYEGLSDGWREFHAWLKAHGHQPRGDLWEVYVSGPETNAPPSQWRTELNRPLAP